MSQYKKPSEGRKKLILILFAPIWILLYLILLVAALVFVVTVLSPFMNQLMLCGPQWYTWHDVKRLTGKSSTTTLFLLDICTATKLLEVRYRSRETMGKLQHRLVLTRSKELPAATGPTNIIESVFFEYRVVRSGRRRRLPWWQITRTIGTTTLQPAYR